MRIAEAARECGLSTYTIRYYEKSGMLPEIARGSDGHRRFSRENLDWLILLASLRETGMPTRKMSRFAGLYRQGDSTIGERKKVLSDHQQYLGLQQARLAKCRKLLTHKLSRYDDILGQNA